MAVLGICHRNSKLCVRDCTSRRKGTRGQTGGVHIPVKLFPAHVVSLPDSSRWQISACTGTLEIAIEASLWLQLMLSALTQILSGLCLVTVCKSIPFAPRGKSQRGWRQTLGKVKNAKNNPVHQQTTDFPSLAFTKYTIYLVFFSIQKKHNLF